VGVLIVSHQFSISAESCLRAASFPNASELRAIRRGCECWYHYRQEQIVDFSRGESTPAIDPPIQDEDERGDDVIGQ
jgi:hypothetical protein